MSDEIVVWTERMKAAGSAANARRIATKYAEWLREREKEMNEWYGYWLRADARAFE